MSDNKQQTAMQLVIGGMHPVVRTIMLSILALPVSFAMACIIMQVPFNKYLIDMADVEVKEAEMRLKYAELALIREQNKARTIDHIIKWVCHHGDNHNPEFCEAK